MFRQIHIWFPIVIILALSACTTSPSAKPNTKADSPKSNHSGQQIALTITINDTSVKPEILKVTVGQTVSLTIQNHGTMLHDFNIKDIPIAREAISHGDSHTMHGVDSHPAVHVAAEAGKTGTVTFVPTTPGTYEYYCSITGHKEAGINGSFIVEATSTAPTSK